MTDYIAFNPATTLLEWRNTLQQATADGLYIIHCFLHTASSTTDNWVGKFYYSSSVTDGVPRSSYVGAMARVSQPFDCSLADHQLADLATVDMTSANMFTVGTAEADFTRYSMSTNQVLVASYQDWVTLVNSGTVTRIKMQLDCSTTGTTCAAVSTEYRLQYKSKNYDI